MLHGSKNKQLFCIHCHPIIQTQHVLHGFYMLFYIYLHSSWAFCTSHPQYTIYIYLGHLSQISEVSVALNHFSQDCTLVFTRVGCPYRQNGSGGAVALHVSCTWFITSGFTCDDSFISFSVIYKWFAHTSSVSPNYRRKGFLFRP